MRWFAFLSFILTTRLVAEGDPRLFHDEMPFLSLRAAGMGEAISPVADGLEAPFYNPAGIGGLYWERESPPTVRNLSFPYIAAQVNNRALGLQNNGGLSDRGIGEANFKAGGEGRYYGEATTALTMGIGRTIYVLSENQKYAAYYNPENPAKPARGHFRTTSIAGMGASTMSYDQRVYFGAFISNQNRHDYVGELEYLDLISRNRRSRVQNNAISHEGATSSIGMIWTLPYASRPAIAMVAKNPGIAKLNHKKGFSEDGTKPGNLNIKENVTLGFGLSPKIGRKGAASFVFEADDLSNSGLDFSKKLRLGMELAFRGFGSEAGLALRAGIKAAGPSFGFSLNLGLLKFEAAMSAHQLGSANSESRQGATFMVQLSSKP